MAENKDINKIREAFEGIRDERVKHANTASRIGNAFLSLLDYASSADNDKLSAINDDTAHGLITFLKGIKIGNLFSFSKEGDIIAHSIATDDYSEAGQKGFCLATKENGGYKLCIEEILAWGLATVSALHVKGAARFDDTIGSPDFVSGFLDGKGWRLDNNPTTNAAGVQENRYGLELDNLIVRGTMRIFEMIISQLLGENDNRIFTAMLEVDHYDPETGRVYLDTHEGRMYNPFRKDDYVMVQQYNGMPSTENNHYVTKRYELIVTEVGSEGSGEDMLAWVKFKNFTSSMEGATAEQLITKRDTFVRVDNLSDPDRKGIIQMMTVGSDTPYMDIIYGLKTDPDNALKGRLGNLRGITHPLFGALSGFGEFLQNLYATGDFVLRRTGESIDTKIQMLQNQFATRFAQTSYEATEENNYLHNGQFLTAIGYNDEQLIDGWTIDDTDESQFWVDANGLPVMVNGAATVSGNHRVSIDNNEGRNMLHIQDSGIKQANDLIRKPGTHKEYTQPSAEKGEDGMNTTGDDYTEVQDTLYISARIYAKTAGTLTFGFEGCKAVEGKTNDLSAQSFSVPYSAEWQTVELNGKWNGTGDFVLRYTGDIYVALLTITDEPLDNLSKTVSTQILQTAKNIKLLGQNIDKVNGTTTQLGIELDAEKEAIRLYVDKRYGELNTTLSSRIEIEAGRIDLINTWQDRTNEKISGIYTDIDSITARVESVTNTANGTKAALAELNITVNGINTTVGKAATKDELNAAKNTLQGTMSDNYNALNSSVAEARRHADSVGSDIRNDYGPTISLVSQNADSWSSAVARFDANGKLKDTSYLITTADYNALMSERFNADGTLKNKGGLLVTADYNALTTKIEGVDGKILSEATIKTMIANGISSATITADQINLNGVVTANSNFKINKDGSMEALAGKIAGFTIQGTGLTNDPFTNDAYIIFRNDTHKCFAGIGGNVLPASSGQRAVARFENEDSSDWWGLGYNIAAILSAKNGAYNFAFTGAGNGVLNGWIGGYKYSRYALSTKNTIYNGYAKISENNVWLIYSYVSSSGITLPTLSEVRSALGCGSSTNFAVTFTVVAEPGTTNFFIYGRNKIKDKSDSYAWNKEELPLILDENCGNKDYIEMGQGDSATFLLVYNSTMGNKVSDYTTKYTARKLNHAY